MNYDVNKNDPALKLLANLNVSSLSKSDFLEDIKPKNEDFEYVDTQCVSNNIVALHKDIYEKYHGYYVDERIENIMFYIGHKENNKSKLRRKIKNCKIINGIKEKLNYIVVKDYMKFRSAYVYLCVIVAVAFSVLVFSVVREYYKSNHSQIVNKIENAWNYAGIYHTSKSSNKSVFSNEIKRNVEDLERRIEKLELYKGIAFPKYQSISKMEIFDDYYKYIKEDSKKLSAPYDLYLDKPDLTSRNIFMSNLNSIDYDDSIICASFSDNKCPEYKLNIQKLNPKYTYTNTQNTLSYIRQK